MLDQQAIDEFLKQLPSPTQFDRNVIRPFIKLETEVNLQETAISIKYATNTRSAEVSKDGQLARDPQRDPGVG